MKYTIDPISRREFIALLTTWYIASEARSGQNPQISPASFDSELEMYYNTAMPKLAARDVEGANMISAVAERFPSSAMAYFIAGNAVLMDQRKNPDERQRDALDKYSRALHLDDKLVGAYLNRGAIRSYMVLPGKQDIQELARKVIGGDLDGALEVKADRLKALEESVADFKKAIALKPNLFSAYYDMGYFLSSCSKGEEAIKSFSKAIEIGLRNTDWSSHTPTYKEEAITEVIMDRASFCLMGGILKFIKDRFGTFQVGTDRIVILDNDEILSSAYFQNEQEALAFAYFQRGLAYMDPGMKKYEEAAADFKKAISLNPSVPKFYEPLFLLQRVRGQTADSDQTLKKYNEVLTKLRDSINQLRR